jgi:uncharacterized protein (TIGR04222 family)
MKPQHADLYARIQTFALDDPDAPFPFSRKLAKENGWTLTYTQRAIDEYKRFALLAMISPEPVSPSEQVDQVWHMHMTYTQSYWDEFCGKVLGKPLHHYPSQGGLGEGQKYRDLYEKTLALYQQVFGEAPPADLWSPTEQRFGDDLAVERVNIRQNWIISKGAVKRAASNAALTVGLTLLVAGCAPVVTNFINPFDLAGPEFLNAYMVLLGAALVAVGLIRWTYAPRGSLDHVPALDQYDIAYLNDGTQRTADTAIVTLIERKVIELNVEQNLVAIGTLHEKAHPVEKIVYEASQRPGGVKVNVARQAAEYVVGNIRERLESVGLIADKAENWTRATLPMLILLALSAFAGMKIAVGMARGRPVVFLMILAGVTIALAVAFGRPLRRSKLADQLIDRLKQTKRKNDSLTPEVQSVDMLGFNVALFGANALAGTPYMPLQQALYPPNAGSGGGDGGAGGGDGGSGGCGGGCGGCGGA